MKSVSSAGATQSSATTEWSRPNLPRMTINEIQVWRGRDPVVHVCVIYVIKILIYVTRESQSSNELAKSTELPPKAAHRPRH